MSKIKHIVYLMLENRSLDQLLGWLYEGEDQPKNIIPKNSSPIYNGLEPNKFYNVDCSGKKHFVTKGVENMNVPIHDPHEKYNHVNNQVYGFLDNPTAEDKPTMGGFYKDFETYHDHVAQIMQTYSPEDLPVINQLAKNFAVSDEYYCSVPTQTNCNRAFAASGNSIGPTKKGISQAWVNNRAFSYLPPHASQPLGNRFSEKTMWNVLSENGYNNTSDWMHYYSQGTWWEDLLGLEGYAYTRDLMMKLQCSSLDNHFDKMDTFYKRAREGNLPKVCFLEPEWGLQFPIFDKDYGVNGNDYHPPTNLEPGEKFLKKIYEALTSNKKAWNETLWIINFDEHGGTYDHVGPKTNAKQPWESDGTTKPASCELDFDFKRFGVRVPFILVSPYVKESTVFRADGDTPFDHTSVIATILKMLNIPKEEWGLGARTANAPTFETIFEGNPARTKIPKIDINKNAIVDKNLIFSSPPNDIQLQMAHSLLQRTLIKKRLTLKEIDKLSLKPLADAKNIVELSKRLKEALTKIKEA